EKGEEVSFCGQGVEWDDSFKEDGVLVGAFGLGDCGVDIGDGVLAMSEFSGEAIGFLLNVFVDEKLEETIVG
ncbi:hypothetical protein Tco_0041102, partial [Tanacetum coccineum]